MTEALRSSTSSDQPMSGESPASGHPSIGSLINGKYLIEEIIGEGGVGVVVAAQNVELSERVALKFLKPEMLERTEIVGRFMHEAKAACSIKSEHSATVYDVGRTPAGVPFLVMEFLEGKDLATIIEEGRQLDVREVAEYGMQVCDALAAAHAKGVVHRDIKPENLFLTTRNGMRSLKVLDFGISKTALTGSVLSSVLPLVKTQALMGTPFYMSPEQVRTPDRIDSRTDIWSLGIVMFEALAGRLPLHAESITELCAEILESPLDSLTQYRQDLPEGFVDVVEKCLEKDVKRRFQNVAEIALALMPFAPKRARICAERAGQALAAAGLVKESEIRLPSSMPPAMSPGSHPSVRLSGSQGISSGSFQIGPPPSFSTPAGLATTMTPAAAPEPRVRAMTVVAVLAIALGLAGAVYGFTRSAPAAVATAASTAPAAPAPEQAPAPIAAAPVVTTTAAAPVEPPVEAQPSAPTRPAPKPVAPAPARAAVAKPASTTAPAPAASLKKADALDIGY